MAGVYRSDEGRERLQAWCADRLAAWPVPHGRTTLETTTGPTHLLVTGEGPRTFVLLPGTHFNAATSLRVVAELRAHGRVVVPDLPGQPGLSTAERPGPERMAAYGRWVDEVVARVREDGAGQLVLVGHSLGAAVALCATPGVVDRLVLVDPAGFVPARVSPAVLAVTLRWLVRPSPRSAAALAGRMSGPGHAPRPELVEWLALVARHVHAAGAPGPLPREVTDRWRGVPRVVVAGAHDCFFRPEALAAAVADRLGEDLVVLDDLGHLGPEEDPSRLAALVAG
ncbi:alpha/beta fold hydrolase [Geodermatophilus sp. SYSU D00691]